MLIKVTTAKDILPEYRDTPIGQLFQYHNLENPYDKYDHAQLLVGMCMDNRKHLHLPDNFAYIIRTAGANLRYSEFNVSYAIAVGSISHIALIAHNNCGMVNLISRKEKFINGLVETAGWEHKLAEENFMHFAPMFEIGNEIEFTLNETARLRILYPKVKIAPIFYKIEDHKLYFIEES